MMDGQDKLKKQIEQLIERGDQKALETFVLEHFTELPEDIQGKVLLSLYTDAVEKEVSNGKVTELQKQGLEAIEHIRKIQAAASEETS